MTALKPFNRRNLSKMPIFTSGLGTGVGGNVTVEQVIVLGEVIAVELRDTSQTALVDKKPELTAVIKKSPFAVSIGGQGQSAVIKNNKLEVEQ